MKVMFVVHGTSMGGATISLLNLIKGLVDLNYKVAVVCPCNIDPVFHQYANNLTIKLYEVPLINDFVPNSWKCVVKSFMKKGWTLYKRVQSKKCLRNIILQWKPDIVHTNVGVIHIASEVCIELGVKHVWHLREYQTKDFNWIILPSKKKFEEKLKKSDAVITITDDIQDFFHLKECSNVFRIYNGVFSEIDKFLSFPKENYFLCASRLSKEKGIIEVIKAFVSIHKLFPDYRLKIAGFGDENYIEFLKDIARTGDCLSSIDFLGFVSDVRPLMKNAKALIVASYNEGFGRMTAEAFFCGCPVVGRNTSGTKEILDKLDSYPYEGDDSNLYNAMKQVILEEEDIYLNKVKKSQQIAISLFSNEQYVKNVVNVYEKLIPKIRK